MRRSNSSSKNGGRNGQGSQGQSSRRQGSTRRGNDRNHDRSRNDRARGNSNERSNFSRDGEPYRAHSGLKTGGNFADASSAGMVLGPHAVEAILASHPGRIREVLIAGEHDDLRQQLSAAGKTVRGVDRAEISRIAGTESHQGIAAMVRPKEFESLDNLIARVGDKQTATIVMLDSINDPHNVGACLRSCECFGVEAVIFSKNRGAPITPTVSKTSVGASELIPLVQVSNLAQAQARLVEEAGFETVVTAIDQRAAALWEFEFPAKTLLIVGAEGPGVQPLLIKKAEHVVYIPMQGVIDSLNVSQALAVCLSAQAGQRARK